MSFGLFLIFHSTRISSPAGQLNRAMMSPLSHLFESIFSYDGNVMLAAIVSLLLVILFVLLLHVYAKWFLAQARQRRQRSMTVSHVLGPARFHHFHTFTFDTSLSSSPTKGLDPSIIASIPLFVYDSDEHNKNGLDFECVVCLSTFEDDDIGRNLPKCGHVFHVECIDMWLQSHSSCPICRAPVVCENKGDDETAARVSQVTTPSGDGDSRFEILIDLSSSGNEDGGSQSSLSVSSSPSSHQSLPSSSLGCSLKRVHSRDRTEQKAFPASNGERELYV